MVSVYSGGMAEECETHGQGELRPIGSDGQVGRGLCDTRILKSSISDYDLHSVTFNMLRCGTVNNRYEEFNEMTCYIKFKWEHGVHF